MRFQQSGNQSNMSGDCDLGGSSAAAFFGSGCDCDNVVLRVGGPRTSGYRLLSGGADGLSAASQLVSARLGIDGALSLRHLCLWTFLLSSGLLPLSGSLPVSASVNSCRTAGPSPAVSASRVVVVINLAATAFGELPIPAVAKILTDSDPPRCGTGSPARRLTVLGVLPISYFVGAPAKAVTAAQSSASPSNSQQTAPIDERLAMQSARSCSPSRR